ncbi:MAG: hypothetical protein H6719_29785 [Sandaracinaceae bacterium]|nr:hypothetical protein [Sandaracinaceae bacterium]
MRRTVAIALLLAGCGAPAQRFALRPTMWIDDDRRAFVGRPAELETPAQWDRIDHTIFRPLAELWLYERETEAVNVNALDEVPSSSWFTNRIGLTPLRPERLARGACRELDTPPGPYTVTRAKSSGTSPGLFVRDASGGNHLMKVDFDLPERGTAADSIATRIFWGVGYETPCNRVIFIQPEDLVLGDGEHAPSREDVEALLTQAVRLEDGRVRVSLSELLPGTPLGGWLYSGIREDDANDVVAHERRREVRGMVVLSAWLNHIDARAENNLDMWVEADGDRGWVQHYVLDAGDSFGQIFPQSLVMSQSFGLSHYVDFQHMLEDFVTLGIAERPWLGARRGPAGDVFGFYDLERFDPHEWRNGYPNPAFEDATERDRAWMARIIARFERAHLEALVATGRFERELTATELVRILEGRQQRILERYLTRLSPLTFPRVIGDRLCLRDVALESGLRRERSYTATALPGWPTERRVPLAAARDDSSACVMLPADPDEDYWAIDVVAATPGRETTGAARVHLYAVDGGWRVVGLERLEP